MNLEWKLKVQTIKWFRREEGRRRRRRMTERRNGKGMRIERKGGGRKRRILENDIIIRKITREGEELHLLEQDHSIIYPEHSQHQHHNQPKESSLWDDSCLRQQKELKALQSFLSCPNSILDSYPVLYFLLPHISGEHWRTDDLSIAKYPHSFFMWHL